MSLHVGTSGWAYPEWRPAVYPAGLPRERFLEAYGQVFGACEVNATHYRVPSPATVAGWSAAVPPDFRFVVKLPKPVADGEPAGSRPLARLVDALEPMGARLGGLLVKVERPRDDAWLGRLVAALPDDVPFVLDLRDPGWSEAAAAAAAEAGGTVCCTDVTGGVPEQLPPGPVAYARLRADRYSSEARAGWRDLLAAEAETRPVYAIARHAGLPADDPLCGVGLAAWLAAGAEA